MSSETTPLKHEKQVTTPNNRLQTPDSRLQTFFRGTESDSSNLSLKQKVIS